MSDGNVLQDLNFWLFEFPEKERFRDLIEQNGGRIVKPATVGRKNVIHIAPPNTSKAELQSSNAYFVFSSDWVVKCIETGVLQEKDPYVLHSDFSEDDTVDPPPPPPAQLNRRGSEESLEDEDDDDKDDGRKGAKKGEKLHPWTGAEFKVLIDYARKNRDSFGVSGNKLWERAEEENILPGRTMQAMRECAKRKRAFIEMDELPSGKLPRAGPTPLEQAITRLCESSGQDVDAACWALYQCNGEFKRAKKILYGEITLNDFHPWSCDEDDVISKYARGLLDAEGSPNKHQHVVNVHQVTDDHESTEIELLLGSRDYHEIAARARYLSDERGP